MIKSILTLTTVFFLCCFFACNEDDPCNAVECLNRGTCIDGECQCPEGTSGERCENVFRTQILGDFDVTLNCTDGTSQTLTWNVDTAAFKLNEVLITDFHQPNFKVFAVIAETNEIEVKEQTLGNSLEAYSFTGSGMIEEEGRFLIDYTVVTAVLIDTVNCSAVAVRQ